MEQRISIERMEQAVNIFGSFDENIRLLEKEFKIRWLWPGELGECLVRHEVIDALLADSVVFAFAGLVDLAVGIDGAHDLDPGFDDFPTRRP